MNPPKPTGDTDMPSDIDFSQGVRGKFYKPNAVFRLPDEADQHCQPATPEASGTGIEIIQAMKEP